MSNLVTLVESLKLKIDELLKRQNQAKLRIKTLEANLNIKSNQIETLKEQFLEIQTNNQALKTANAMLGSNEYKRETKHKINTLIREIDQCIVQLSE